MAEEEKHTIVPELHVKSWVPYECSALEATNFRTNGCGQALPNNVSSDGPWLNLLFLSLTGGEGLHSAKPDPVPQVSNMGKQKTKKLAVMKRIHRLKRREVPKPPSCLFLLYNTQPGPLYHLLVHTNFIVLSIKAKLDIVQSLMDRKRIPNITECVRAEIQKPGMKCRVW